MTVLTGPPAEIVATPLTLYIAPIGSAVPLVDTVPASGTWTLVGQSGVNDYDAAGLTVTHSQTIGTWTSVGQTAPIAAWRTDEVLEIAVTLADISPTTYALALNDVAVTTVAATTGVPGESDISLLQGLTVNTFALLARGVSSTNPTLAAQYWVPMVYQSANPAPVYKKGAPAELALTFSTLLDPNGNGFGKLQIQTAARV